MDSEGRTWLGLHKQRELIDGQRLTEKVSQTFRKHSFDQRRVVSLQGTGQSEVQAKLLEDIWIAPFGQIAALAFGQVLGTTACKFSVVERRPKRLEMAQYIALQHTDRSTRVIRHERKEIANPRKRYSAECKTLTIACKCRKRVRQIRKLLFARQSEGSFERRVKTIACRFSNDGVYPRIGLASRCAGECIASQPGRRGLKER